MVSNNAHKEPIKLNLGCGLNAPLGWVNIDASFSARLSNWRGLYNAMCKFARVKPVPWPKNIKIVDVRKGLPFSDGTIKAIFSSHMLEHMTYEDANLVIKECYRCLCEGGVIRIIVPDLYQIAKRYVDLMVTDPKGEHSYNFLQDLNMQEGSYKGLLKVLHKIFGHSRHRHMYDEWSLMDLLEKQGFKNIQRMCYGQSRIPDNEMVEDKGRHEMAVCLEGIKE
ncbi:MAG: methyltransferase domain-containing protein [Nitrospirota bacterium]